MKIKEELKRFINKIKKIYIHICKFISDTFHGKADGSLVNWFAILFVIGASIILPVSMGTAYYSYIGLVIVAEIVYFISIILLFSSTILFDRKKVIYWISDILLLIRYITLIDIGSEWNKQFSIAYVGVLIIYFVSLLSLSSAKHINYKGGKIDTIIFAIGLACFLIGIITNQSESIYSKILILTGLIVIYLYAISRVLFWIFFAKEKVKFNLLKTMGCIVLFVGLIIAVPFILEYAGISPEVIKEIIVPIYSAGVGGILALAGVAWTIKNGERVREDDERKRENERKEEERKKFIPYLKLVTVNNSNTKNVRTLSLVFSEIHKYFETTIDEKDIIEYRIQNFHVKNISNGIVVLKSIEIDGNIYNFNGDLIIEKGTTVTIETTGNNLFYAEKKNKKLALLCCDIMENYYKLECSTKYSFDVNKEKEYTFTVEAISLPELMQEEK